MQSKGAEELIKLRCCNKAGIVVRDMCVDEVTTIVEIAEDELRQKAIDAFDEFVRQYCCDCNIHQISDDADHYLKVFEKLISNKPNELE